MYRTPIVVGDRVALAPHLDLWMAGVRYGTVSEVNQHVGYTEYLVDYGEGVAQRQVWLRSDDLLGAVAGTPVGGARSSTNPDSIGAGWPEEGE